MSTTEWAECAICSLSTDPTLEPPGDRDNTEVSLYDDGNGAYVAHDWCKKHGAITGLADYM